MDEAKFKRLITSLTVGAVLLLVILLSIMVYQLISINVETKRKNELNEAIARYSEMIDDGSETLDIVREKWWIERRARELGLIYPDDILYK